MALSLRDKEIQAADPIQHTKRCHLLQSRTSCCMKTPDILTYLDDICEQSENIMVAVGRMDYQEFLTDPLYSGGIIRFIEIIGEAAKHLPEEIRTEYPDIPWRKMAGMRDRLIHAYANVNLKYVWDLAVNDIPPLYKQISALRTALELNQ